MSEFVFVGGSTTSGRRTGVSIFRFDEQRAELERVGEVGDIENPSYLSVDGQLGLVYVCSETETNGTLVTYRFDVARAVLVEIDRQPTLGAFPCFNRISRDRQFLLVANYGNPGTNPDKAVVAFQLDGDGLPQPGPLTLELTGSGLLSDRQERSHPHSVMETADNNTFVIADLGTDSLSLVRTVRHGLEVVSHRPLLPGSGPRHSRLHPDAPFLLVCCELDSTVLSLDANFRMVDRQSTLPPAAAVENTTAEIRVSPDGRFVYVSNRGHDSIALFGFDRVTGALNPMGHFSTGGATPRNFQISRSGKCLFAANQISDSLAVFARETETGSLEQRSMIKESSPTCIKSCNF